MGQCLTEYGVGVGWEVLDNEEGHGISWITVNLKGPTCSWLNTLVDYAELHNPNWNSYLTVHGTVGKCQGCSSRDTDVTFCQRWLGENRLTLVLKALGFPPSRASGAWPAPVSWALPTLLSSTHSAVPGNEEQTSFQKLGASVVCLRGPHCTDSLKIIPSKLIKMLYLLIF